MKTQGRKAEWATLQQLAIRYQGLTDDLADVLERTALRNQISRHIAGVFLQCQGEAPADVDAPGAERGALLVRRDSLLERLIKEELAAHTRRSGGQRLLQAAHGGTDAFAPVAAQVFLQNRSLKTQRAATFLSALLDGYRGEGSLEGFMRRCVRHFLADMARAREPLERTSRNPARRALLSGEAQPAEEAVPAADDPAQAEAFLDAAASAHAAGDDAWAYLLDQVSEAVADMQDQLDALDRSLLDQLMGLAENREGKALAAQFGVTPSAVSQRKKKLIERLRAAMSL